MKPGHGLAAPAVELLISRLAMLIEVHYPSFLPVTLLFRLAILLVVFTLTMLQPIFIVFPLLEFTIVVVILAQAVLLALTIFMFDCFLAIWVRSNYVSVFYIVVEVFAVWLNNDLESMNITIQHLSSLESAFFFQAVRFMVDNKLHSLNPTCLLVIRLNCLLRSFVLNS